MCATPKGMWRAYVGFFCFFILSLFWGAVSVKIGFVKGFEIFFEPFPFFASNIKCI